jgi:hypothetical protein
MPYGLAFLIHLSTLYLVMSHQIRNKQWNNKQNSCIHTAIQVSVLFRLHGISGLSSGDVLLPSSLPRAIQATIPGPDLSPILPRSPHLRAVPHRTGRGRLPPPCAGLPPTVVYPVIPMSVSLATRTS